MQMSDLSNIQFNIYMYSFFNHCLIVKPVCVCEKQITQSDFLTDILVSVLICVCILVYSYRAVNCAYSMHMWCECICVHACGRVWVPRLNLAPCRPSLLSLWALLKFQPDLLLREGSLLSHMAVRIRTGRLFSLSLSLTVTQQARVFPSFAPLD